MISSFTQNWPYKSESFDGVLKRGIRRKRDVDVRLFLTHDWPIIVAELKDLIADHATSRPVGTRHLL